MKEKVLAQLILKYPGVSKKFLGLLAEKQSTKVTEESQIEGVINELDNLPISVTDLAAEWQKEGDARVNAAKQEWLKAPPKPDKPPKTETPGKEPPPDEMPDWAKGLVETVNSLKAEKQQQTMQQKLSANEKLKGIDAKLYSKWQLPKSEEEIEAFADEVVATYGHLVTNTGEGATGSTFVPGHQRTGAATTTKKVDPDLVNFAKSKNEQAKAKAN